jgi:hypothetical protein
LSKGVDRSLKSTQPILTVRKPLGGLAGRAKDCAINPFEENKFAGDASTPVGLLHLQVEQREVPVGNQPNHGLPFP